MDFSKFANIETCQYYLIMLDSSLVTKPFQERDLTLFIKRFEKWAKQEKNWGTQFKGCQKLNNTAPSFYALFDKSLKEEVKSYPGIKEVILTERNF